jgi:hypothetical protein
MRSIERSAISDSARRPGDGPTMKIGRIPDRLAAQDGCADYLALK